MELKKMNRKILRSLLILDVIIAGFALVFVLVALWNKPLGPVLGLPTTLPNQEGNTLNLPVVNPKNSVSIPEPSPTHSSLLSQIVSLLKPPASKSESLCGGPPVMTFLVVGSDGRSGDYLYGLADSIRIVRIGFATPNVMVLDIPRDLWVEIPDISDHYGITHGKLNQAYFFGNPGMGYYDGPGEGPGLLARTLEQNFGLSVDHYLAVDMNTFVRLVDAVDGIDIYLDSTIDLNHNHDGEIPEYVLGPGIHHLDGQMALKLARNRYPTTFQRARYQNLVLRALQAKLLTPAMLPELPQLISQFAQSVQTDLSPNDINMLVCISKALTKDNSSMLAFPEDMFSSGHIYDPYRQVNTYIMETDFNQIRSYIADFMNGTWPMP
jgi:LCP family protein required for cell wall assembly